MFRTSRRDIVGLGLATAALPRIAAAQGDTRPTITVAVQKITNTNTLDTLLEQSSNVSERVTNSITELLIGRDYRHQLERIPALATSWRRIDDGTVELTLRRGVKFHDGSEMTAEDVAFSFGPERMFGGAGAKKLPAEIPAVARRHWPALKAVEIVDSGTVRFVNATPDVTVEGRISAGGSEIVSRRAFEAAPTWNDYARKPIGTGPYKVREYKGDNILTLDAHDDYWGGRPPIKTLRFVEAPEVSARVNGLLSGLYDFACDIPPDQIADIEKNPKFEVQGGMVLNHRIVNFDSHHPALRDPRVRLAMAHAIDGQAIVDSLWAGRTRVPPGLQWEFYGDMFVPGWTVPPTDLARARQLLKDSGYKGDPIPYRVRNDYYTAEIATAQVLLEMWREAGLNVVLEVNENWSQVLDTTRPRGLRDWSNAATFDDPMSSIVNQEGPHGAQQQVGEWTNAEMNAMCNAMESSTDRAARRGMFARMLQICEREDPAYIVLHQNATFTAKRRDIHWKAAPAFAMDFRAGNWG